MADDASLGHHMQNLNVSSGHAQAPGSSNKNGANHGGSGTMQNTPGANNTSTKMANAQAQQRETGGGGFSVISQVSQP